MLILTFKLWDAATAGTELWTETQAGTPVHNGIMNVILGSVNPLNIPFDKQYWLGITVGTDPELTPRVQLTSSPYSLSAQSVTGTSNVFPSSGNVGIGISGPSDKLDVSGGGIRISGHNAGAIDGNIFGAPSQGTFRKLIAQRSLSQPAALAGFGIIGAVHVESPVIWMYDNATYGNAFHVKKVPSTVTRNPATEGSTLFMVRHDGNVGIGTTSPAYKLDVSGDINFTGSLFQNGSPFGGGSSVWSLNGLSAFYNAGNVGIGTTNPVQKLDIRGDTVYGQIKGIFDAGLILDAGGVNTEASTFYYRDGLNRVKTYLTSDNSFRIFVNLADRMTITPNGFLGIGTTSPAYKLDVSGDINFTGSLLQNGSPFGGGSSVWSLNGSSAYYNAGNVGIGTTSPDYKLDVSGDINFTGSLLQNGSPFGGGSSLWSRTGSSAYYAGNVGIGTTTPTTLLEVACPPGFTNVKRANNQLGCILN